MPLYSQGGSVQLLLIGSSCGALGGAASEVHRARNVLSQNGLASELWGANRISFPFNQSDVVVLPAVAFLNR